MWLELAKQWWLLKSEKIQSLLINTIYNNEYRMLLSEIH